MSSRNIGNVSETVDYGHKFYGFILKRLNLIINILCIVVIIDLL